MGMLKMAELFLAMHERIEELKNQLVKCTRIGEMQLDFIKANENKFDRDELLAFLKSTANVILENDNNENIKPNQDTKKEDSMQLSQEEIGKLFSSIFGG